MSDLRMLKVVVSLLAIVLFVQIGIAYAASGYPPVEGCMDKCYEYCGADCQGLNGTCTGSNGNPGYKVQCWSGATYCCYLGAPD